jgi:hypothetical protein
MIMMQTTRKTETNIQPDNKSMTPLVKPLTPVAPSQSYFSFFWQSKDTTQPQTTPSATDMKKEAPGNTAPDNTLKPSKSMYEMSKEDYKEQPENVDLETASSIDPFLLDEPTLSYIGRIFKCLTMPGR